MSKTEKPVVQNEVVVGQKVPTTTQYSTYFEKNFNVNGAPSNVDLEAIYNAPQDNIETIVAYSKYCYRKYGLIMRTVNIMRDFGSVGLHKKYPNKNKKAKELIEAYDKKVNMPDLIRSMLYELILTGNLACYDRANRVDIYPIDRIQVVPLVINNKQVIAYKLEDDASANADDYGAEYNKAIESAYPEEILTAMKKGDEYAVLSPEYAYFAKINSSQYERYGISVIMPAFEDLAHKSLLKETERATANDIIDKIMMIQIGDADNKPTKAMIDGYTSLFTDIRGSVRFTVPYYVNASFVEPQTTAFGNEKFLEVDTDILNTLGISLSLLRGSDGSNYADGILNFSGVRKTIENVREPITKIIYGLYQAELTRNGVNPEYAPTPCFDEVVIDKEAKVGLMLELFQNAGLPYQVLYEEAGLDFDHIKLIRENENTEDMDTVFEPHTIPFAGPGNGSDESGAPEKKMSDRKSDKEQSNNNQPRTKLKNTNRSASRK